MTEIGGFEHTPEIVDFSLYVRQSSDYVIYEAERMAALTTATIMRNLCQEQYRDTKMEIIKIDKETFGRRAGGVLYTFTCTKKTGKLKATNGQHACRPYHHDSNESCNPKNLQQIFPKQDTHP